MLLQKGKKSLIYFFLFILVGSINNTKLSNIKFENVKNIKVSGLENIENQNLNQEIRDLNLGNIFFLKADKIEKTIDTNSLIEKYIVYKTYPSTIDIKIIRTKFLAKINSNGKLFLIGTNGKLTLNSFNKQDLPFIFGKPQVKEFLLLKNIIDQSKFRFEQVENFYFFSSKRWDIELKNNIILKLPEKNIKESLNYVFDFLTTSNLQNIKIVDMRIKNQIIIND